MQARRDIESTLQILRIVEHVVQVAWNSHLKVGRLQVGRGCLSRQLLVQGSPAGEGDHPTWQLGLETFNSLYVQGNHRCGQFVSFFEAFLPSHHLDMLGAFKVQIIDQWVQGR